MDKTCSENLKVSKTSRIWKFCYFNLQFDTELIEKAMQVILYIRENLRLIDTESLKIINEQMDELKVKVKSIKKSKTIIKVNLFIVNERI